MSQVTWLFFGIDGTLVNHELAVRRGVDSLREGPQAPAWARAPQCAELWRLGLSDADHRFLLDERSFIESRRDIVRSFDRSLNPSRCDDLYRSYFGGYLDGIEGFGDVATILFKLRERMKLGILGRGDEPTERQKISQLGIADLFRVICISRYAWRGDSRFVEFVRRCNLSGEDAVFIGSDYERDVLPLRSLGIHVVFLDRSKERFLKGVPTIHTLDELPRYLAAECGIEEGGYL